MMRIVLFIVTMISVVSVHGQQYTWFKQIGGADDDRANVMLLDNNGDLIIVGNFMGTVDFDPSAGISEATSNGWYDIFVAKYDTLGNLIWVKTMGSTEWDYGQVLMVDNTNNVYIAGSYGSTMDVDPGVGVTTLIPNGGLSAYVVKLNTNGEYQWSRNLTGGTDLRVTALKQAPQGIVIAGSFWGTCEFNNEGTSVTMTSDGSQGVYVLTVDESGNFVSAIQLGNSGQNIPRGFDIDNLGNIYLTCEFENSIDVDPGPGTTLLTTTNTSNYGQLLAKYNSAMELQWVKTPDFPTYSTFRQIEILNDNEIFFVGYFKDSIRFDQFGETNWYYSEGDDDQFIAKMNASGTIQWIRRFGNSEEDDGAKLSLDQSGNLYLYDSFRATIDTDPGSGNIPATSIGSRDTYVLKLNTDGDFLWFLQDSTDYGHSSGINAVVPGTLNDLYLAYSFYTEMGVVQNETTYSFTSVGDFDMVLMQLKADNFLNLYEKEDSRIVYPNPTSGDLFLNGLNGPENYQLIDRFGRVIENGQTSGYLSLVHLNPGLYFLYVGSNKYKISKQ